MKLFFKKFRRINKGFTLVETLVAISIFSLSILALMAVLTQGVSDTNYAKKKIIASYLAQEGIEYIRNMRDTFVLYSTNGQTGWNDFKVKLDPCDATSNGTKSCYFDDNNLNYANHSQQMALVNTIFACSGSCPLLLYDGAGKYGYASLGAASDFVRKIVMTQVSINEIKISSTVSWTQGSGNYSMVFSESLFNWVE